MQSCKEKSDDSILYFVYNYQWKLTFLDRQQNFIFSCYVTDNEWQILLVDSDDSIAFRLEESHFFDEKQTFKIIKYLIKAKKINASWIATTDKQISQMVSSRQQKAVNPFKGKYLYDDFCSESTGFGFSR